MRSDCAFPRSGCAMRDTAKHRLITETGHVEEARSERVERAGEENLSILLGVRAAAENQALQATAAASRATRRAPWLLAQQRSASLLL